MKKMKTKIQDTDNKSQSAKTLHFLATPETEGADYDEDDASVEEIRSAPKERYTLRTYTDSVFRGPLAKKYIGMSVSDERERRGRRIDYTYGVWHSKGKWMVGDSTLDIDKNDNFHINGKEYTGTSGLYKLLFMQRPKESSYSVKDMEVYKDILEATNSHRKKYLSDAQPHGSKGYKYKTIWKLFIKGKGYGNTYMRHTTNPVTDYVNWDDPNKLVQRLHLLIASQNIGHTGHANEIASIVEELREAGIIV